MNSENEDMLLVTPSAFQDDARTWHGGLLDCGRVVQFPSPHELQDSGKIQGKQSATSSGRTVSRHSKSQAASQDSVSRQPTDSTSDSSRWGATPEVATVIPLTHLDSRSRRMTISWRRDAIGRRGHVSLGRFLCRIGLHRYEFRTRRIGDLDVTEYRCSRVECHLHEPWRIANVDSKPW